MTYYQTAGTKLENDCGWKTNGAAPVKAYTYLWGIDENGRLVLVDQNTPSCVASPGYASCRTTLDRQ